MTSNLFLYQCTVLVALLSLSTSKYNLVPNMNKYCPKTADIRQKVLEKDEAPWNVMVKNIDNTIAQITATNAKPVGEGAFGTVIIVYSLVGGKIWELRHWPVIWVELGVGLK